jgi:magnesium chelatase family protein
LAQLQLDLEAEAANLLEVAATRLGLSSRGQVRSLRVARTIADLAGSTMIRRTHIAEALAFRHRMPGRVAA